MRSLTRASSLTIAAALAVHAVFISGDPDCWTNFTTALILSTISFLFSSLFISFSFARPAPGWLIIFFWKSVFPVLPNQLLLSCTGITDCCTRYFCVPLTAFSAILSLLSASLLVCEPCLRSPCLIRQCMKKGQAYCSG